MGCRSAFIILSNHLCYRWGRNVNQKLQIRVEKWIWNGYSVVLKFRRGVGAADRAGLESLCRALSTAGSNPALSVDFGDVFYKHLNLRGLQNSFF